MKQQTIFSDTFVSLDKYHGKKSAAGSWQQIISQIPKCNLFIDAMTGSGQITAMIKQYGNCDVISNDIDLAVIQKLSSTPCKGVEFSNVHYSHLLSRYNNGSPGRVFYFDPPYLMETRSGKKPLYRYEWTVEDHNDFLKAIVQYKSPIMVSHYQCKKYDKALKDWRKISYTTMTHAGARTENLYLNFPQPVLLECHQVVGKNFTDRQRIKRKSTRLINKLINEDPKERAAILSAVIASFDYVISK